MSFKRIRRRRLNEIWRRFNLWWLFRNGILKRRKEGKQTKENYWSWWKPDDWNDLWFLLPLRIWYFVPCISIWTPKHKVFRDRSKKTCKEHFKWTDQISSSWWKLIGRTACKCFKRSLKMIWNGSWFHYAFCMKSIHFHR